MTKAAYNEETKGAPVSLGSVEQPVVNKQAIFNDLVKKNLYSAAHARGYFFAEGSLQHAHQTVIAKGLQALRRAEILTRENQAAVIAAGKGALEVAYAIEALNDANIILTNDIYFKLLHAGKHANEEAKRFIRLHKAAQIKKQQPSWFSRAFPWFSRTNNTPPITNNAYSAVDEILKKLEENNITLSEAILDAIDTAHKDKREVKHFLEPLLLLNNAVTGVVIRDDFIESIASYITNPVKMSDIARGFIKLRDAEVLITDKIKAILFNEENKDLPFRFSIVGALVSLKKDGVDLTDALLDAIDNLDKMQLDDNNFDGRIDIAKKQYANGVQETEIISMLRVPVLNIQNEMKKQNEEAQNRRIIQGQKQQALKNKTMLENAVEEIVEGLKDADITLSLEQVQTLESLSSPGLGIFSASLKIIVDARISLKTMQDVFFNPDTLPSFNPKVANAIVSLQEANIQYTYAMLNAIARVANVADEYGRTTVTAAQNIANALIYLAEKNIKPTGNDLLEFIKSPHNAKYHAITIDERATALNAPKKACAILKAHDIQLNGIVAQEFNSPQKINFPFVRFAILLIKLKRRGISLTDQHTEALYFSAQFDLPFIEGGIASLYNAGILAPSIIQKVASAQYMAETAAMGLIFLKNIGLRLTDDLIKIFFLSFAEAKKEEGNISNAITQCAWHVIDENNESKKSGEVNLFFQKHYKEHYNEYVENHFKKDYKQEIQDLIISYLTSGTKHSLDTVLQYFTEMPEQNESIGNIVIETAEFLSISYDELLRSQTVKASSEGEEEASETASTSNNSAISLTPKENFDLIKKQHFLLFKIRSSPQLNPSQLSPQNYQSRLTISDINGPL